MHCFLKGSCMLKNKYILIKYFAAAVLILTAGIVYSLEVEQSVLQEKDYNFSETETDKTDCINLSETSDNAGSKTVESFEKTIEAAEGTVIAEHEAAVSGTTGGTDAKKDSEYVLCVYVCGEVSSPGVYELASGTRIADAVREAGGMTENADSDYLNLALFLSDGQKVYVPSKEEVTNNGRQTEKLTEMSYYVSGIPENSQEKGQAGKTEVGKNVININSAGLSELVKIPGIGEKRARTIIDYRNSFGLFKTTADIKKVSGIKDALYEKIKEYICVE